MTSSVQIHIPSYGYISIECMKINIFQIFIAGLSPFGTLLIFMLFSFGLFALNFLMAVTNVSLPICLGTSFLRKN